MRYCFGVDVGGTTVKLGFFDEEGNLLPSAYEILDDEAASERWKELLSGVADKFDVLADPKKVEKMDSKQYRAAAAAAFDGLKEIFPDLSW